MNTFVVLQLVVVSVAALALLWLGRRAGAVSGGDPLRLHRRYQPRSVLVAVGTLVASAGLRWAGGVRVEPLGFLGVGNLDVPARDIGPLADPGDAWLTVGLRFGLIATVVTAVVVYLQVDKRPPLRAVIAVLPVATVVSLVNAGVEELIFRLALVQGLHDLVSAPTLAICSGVLFGVPHYFGNPGKIPGVLMAGFIGWLMCTATLQTGGLAWAFALHVVQDVVILSILFAATRAEKAAERSRGQGVFSK